MDGHLGTAASHFVRDNLPEAFYTEILRESMAPTDGLLERAWNDVCDDYRAECSIESCAAEYNKEGLLMAHTASTDTEAGSTACIMALDLQTSHLGVLNCGDPRALVIDEKGDIRFQTSDHTPGSEKELLRFEEAKSQGLGYSEPFCQLSKWRLPVGEYNYAVSRSLEGPFATSKGIVSMPDVSTFQFSGPAMIAVVATDGFWEVIDSKEAARILHRIRHKQGTGASDAAKTLCSLAVERGPLDNVSSVVIYLS